MNEEKEREEKEEKRDRSTSGGVKDERQGDNEKQVYVRGAAGGRQREKVEVAFLRSESIRRAVAATAIQ